MTQGEETLSYSTSVLLCGKGGSVNLSPGSSDGSHGERRCVSNRASGAGFCSSDTTVVDFQIEDVVWWLGRISLAAVWMAGIRS